MHRDQDAVGHNKKVTQAGGLYVHVGISKQSDMKLVGQRKTELKQVCGASFILSFNSAISLFIFWEKDLENTAFRYNNFKNPSVIKSPTHVSSSDELLLYCRKIFFSPPVFPGS